MIQCFKQSLNDKTRGGAPRAERGSPDTARRPPAASWAALLLSEEPGGSRRFRVKRCGLWKSQALSVEGTERSRPRGSGHVTSRLCAFLRSNSRAVAGPAREAILRGRAGAALAYGSSTSSSLPHLCGIHTGGPVGDVQGTRRLQQNHCPCRRQAQPRAGPRNSSLPCKTGKRGPFLLVLFFLSVRVCLS